MILLPRRELWTPRASRFRQRGFLLNPYRLHPPIVVAATNNGTDHTGAATTTTVQLPSGFASGMLGILILGASAAVGTMTATGWTQFGSTTGLLGMMYRFADGSEGSSIVVSHNSIKARAWSARITGAHGSSAPEQGTEASGTSTTPDPPNLTPSWGAASTMWIAMLTSNGGSALTGYPANYVDNQYASAWSSPTLGLATRSLVATSENPGTFTMTGSTSWNAQTVAVRPST